MPTIITLEIDPARHPLVTTVYKAMEFTGFGSCTVGYALTFTPAPALQCLWSSAARLDDRTLKQGGLTADEAEAELRKIFSQAPRPAMSWHGVLPEQFVTE